MSKLSKFNLSQGHSHTASEEIRAIKNGFIKKTTVMHHNPDAKTYDERYKEHSEETFHRVHPHLKKAVSELLARGGGKKKGGHAAPVRGY